MKILQINSVYGYASTGKIVANIHESLLQDGIDSYVIYSRKEPKNCTMKNVTRIYSPLGVAVHAALSLFFDKHGLYSKCSTKKILKKIDEINPDIVHLHVIHGFYINYPMLFDYLKKKNKRVIWTLHDCWQFTGYCAYYDFNECDGWKTGCKTCKYRNTYPYRFLSNSKNNFEIKRKAYEGLNLTIVSPSKWLDGEVSKSMMSHFDHQVIHNDIDLSKFYYEPSNYREKYNLQGKKILLAVANVWTAPKGYYEILKLSKIIDDNTKIVMIGLSKKQIKNCPGNILGFERVQLEELRKWYSAADVFINCTLEDNYPTVNLEARACGLPIITYNTGGSVESAGDNCIVVDRGNVDEIEAKAQNIPSTKNLSNEILPKQMYAMYKSVYGNKI